MKTAFILEKNIHIASDLYFFNGSLEMFPTAEKESGVRLIMGIIAVSCVVIETILIALLKKVPKGRGNQQ